MKRKENIRVLLISPFFAPHFGGDQRYMEELYVHLREQFRQVSVDVLTYNTRNAPPYELHRGLRVYRIPCWEVLPSQFALPNPVSLITTLYKLSANHYHFVHTHKRYFDATWWAWIYALLIKATSIFTEHVASRATQTHPSVEQAANLVDTTLAAWSLPHYRVVTATTRSAQQFLNRTYHLPQAIQLVTGGVDTAYFTPIPKSKRTISVLKKKIKPTDTIVTFIGRLDWTKGATKLYRTFRRLLPKLKKNVYLVIAGTGELAPNFKKQIRLDNLSERVWFLGALDPKRVKEVMQASDIFVLPSHHNEGFPHAILEAGAAGTYVIATDVSGVRDVIIPGKTGALIPADDEAAIAKALFRAIERKKQTHTIAMNLRKLLVKHFNWNDVSTSYMRLLISNLKPMSAKRTAWTTVTTLAKRTIF